MIAKKNLASQLTRAKHLATSLPIMTKDLDDAQACMVELTKETPAFTAEQCKQMAETVTVFMYSETTVDSDCKSQNHPYVHEYMPDGIWKK